MDLEAEIKKRWPLLLILIFAFSVRVSFVNTNKAIWWDEAQYMLGARDYTQGLTGLVWEGRTFLFQAMLIPFVGNEVGARYLEIFFSLITVATVYLFCEKYLNKKTAIFASLIMSSMWLEMFYSVRILTDVPSASILLLSMYLFFDKGGSIKKTFFSAFLFAMAFIVRFPSAISLFTVIIYGLFTKQYKEKNFYLWFLFLGICIIPLFIHDAVVYGDAFTTTRTFIQTNVRFDKTGSTTDQPWNYYIQIMPDIFTSPMLGIPSILLVFFIIGLILLILNIKNKKSLFLIIYATVTFLALSSLTNKQDRFLMPILPIFSIIGALGLVKSVNFITKFFKSKISDKTIEIISLVIISVLILFIVVPQITFGSNSILAKADSYKEIRYAGEWINSNSDKDAVIASVSEPQIRYYSDRNNIIGFQSTLEGFISEVQNKTVDFYVTSMYEPMPEFMKGDLREYNLTIGDIWTIDIDGVQYPIAIVWAN